MNKKAISIQQPWAYLICKGIKDIENRTWKTSFRGRVYIHVGVKSAKEPYMIFTDEQGDAIDHLIMDVLDSYKKRSAIIGSVEIVDCVVNHSSIWAEKTEGIIDSNTKEFIAHRDNKIIYNWVLANPVLFDEPILDVKGKLSFWDCSTYITAK